MKALIQWFRNLLKPVPVKRPKRICYMCKLPIKRAHKYLYFERGTRHWDCSNPALAPAQIPIPE